MARRTFHIPDDVDERVRAELDHGDSYSAVASEGLRRILASEEWPDEILDRAEIEQ